MPDTIQNHAPRQPTNTHPHHRPTHQAKPGNDPNRAVDSKHLKTRQQQKPR